jgi:predicted aldo/keto reductase-like oxidoreductase
MKYRQFGQFSGVNISRLGFGAMRLPMTEIDGKRVVDEDQAVPLLHRAYELGVNYFDTAWMYCDELSEATVGKAVKPFRDKVLVSDKYPVGIDKGYRETLEIQLGRLGLDYLDFYHFHGISEGFLTNERRDEFIKEALQAKEEGLIRNISFSFHDKPEAMAKIIDLGLFSSVLCQYNLMDRANEAAMANAKAKGLGVVVMGPVGGGRIAGLPPDLIEQAGIQVLSNAQLAFRFVFANPHVDCALSGMSTLQMLEENVVTASNEAPLSNDEVDKINAVMAENKRLADLYCTGCDYCKPYCPQEVNISRIFLAMNYARIYKLEEHARFVYNSIGSQWVKGAKADACIECGECESHCPQKIEIRKQLKDCLAVLGS